jgi:hypothetical protein
MMVPCSFVYNRAHAWKDLRTMIAVLPSSCHSAAFPSFASFSAPSTSTRKMSSASSSSSTESWTRKRKFSLALVCNPLPRPGSHPKLNVLIDQTAHGIPHVGLSPLPVGLRLTASLATVSTRFRSLMHWEQRHSRSSFTRSTFILPSAPAFSE